VRRSGLQAAGAMRLPVSVLTAVLLSLALPLSASGQATQPLASPSDQVTEAQPLRISAGESRAITARVVVPGSSTSNYSDLSRIAVALLVVIGIILLLRSVFRQMTAIGGVGPAGRGGKMVTVLSRSAISPRQQVLVLQVGKRLIVVGDSGGRMNPLCEISDPDEVALLVGQNRAARDAGADRNPGSFRSLFRRANEPFSETEALALMPENFSKPINPDDGVSSQEMNGLMDKVRMLQEQFRLKA
jgi:flagellar biogenesis protein FliO